MKRLWLGYILGLVAGVELIAASRTLRRALRLIALYRATAHRAARILAGFPPPDPGR